jgi:MFS family permease
MAPASSGPRPRPGPRTQPAAPGPSPRPGPSGPRAAPSGADSRRWVALVFIALAQLMVALDATIVNIALPSTQADLHFSDAQRQWLISAYTLAFGGLLLLGGRVADRLGRRRSLLLGLAGFAATSALSGAAPDLGLLVGARALQGACAALLAPTALSLLAVTFTEPHDRAKAFAVYGAIAASGGAVGLILGGLLAQSLGWRWCLYVNVPIAALAAVGARFTLAARAPVPGRGPGLDDPAPARGHEPADRGRDQLDLLGVALGGGGLVALVYGCAQAVSLGWRSPLVAGLLVAAGASLALFVAHESHAADPLLPLGIVAHRQRGGAYACVALAVAGMFGAFLFLTYELQVVLGYPPVTAGLAFLPLSAAVLVGSGLIASRLLPRVPAAALMVPGFLVAAGGMALLAQLRSDSAYATSILPAELLLGLGIGCAMMPATSLGTAGVDRRVAGVASATVNTAQQVGASLGTALLGSVAAAATAAYLAARPQATQVEGLVHGYAAAAAWGAAILVLGAAVAAWSGARPSPSGAPRSST